MSYCTQSGTTAGDIMPSRISEEQLLQLVTEDDTIGTEEQQKVIDEAIASADSEIDSYCAIKYSVPFSPVPTRIKNLSADMATYHLFKKRAAAIGMPEAIRQMYDDAIAFLKDVSKGLASLGVDPPPTSTSTIGVKVKTNERMFTKDTLKGL